MLAVAIEANIACVVCAICAEAGFKPIPFNQPI